MRIHNSTNRIGIIGLGVLGSYVASKYLKKGYFVYILDKNREKLKHLTDKGAFECFTPREITQKSDFIFEISSDDNTSREIWKGKEGIIESADANKILICSSTLSVGWVDELAGICKKKHLNFFDMAINGGDKGLTLLCGGDKELLKSLKPVLRAVFDKIIHFGPVGQGMRFKLILNFLQAVHIIGFTHALRIAKSQHMNISKVGDALSVRPGGVLTNIVWDNYQNPFEDVAFKIELIAKDLKYAVELAKDCPSGLLNVVFNEYKEEIDKGNAKKDWIDVVNLDK